MQKHRFLLSLLFCACLLLGGKSFAQTGPRLELALDTIHVKHNGKKLVGKPQTVWLSKTQLKQTVTLFEEGRLKLVATYKLGNPTTAKLGANKTVCVVDIFYTLFVDGAPFKSGSVQNMIAEVFTTDSGDSRWIGYVAGKEGKETGRVDFQYAIHQTLKH
jgi:hypothetical protein